jgi:hypothetical protein
VSGKVRIRLSLSTRQPEPVANTAEIWRRRPPRQLPSESVASAPSRFSRSSPTRNSMCSTCSRTRSM